MDPPASFGPYAVVAPLGGGASGVVFRARDERLGREVALKLIHAPDSFVGEQWAEEARLLGQLNHPGIAILYDVGRLPQGYFLVMELIEGPGLDELVRRYPHGLPEEEVIRLGRELAEALAAAHARGVLHRDLKPSNLRLAADGRLKILDFGLAVLLEQLGQTATRVARVSEPVGTLPYMAPEQWRGEPLDERTDVWAAGAVLYELATGRRAFPQSTAALLEQAIGRGQLVPPRHLRPELSRGLERVIRRALAPVAAQRYASARELERALAALGAPAAPRAPRKRISVLVGEIHNYTGEPLFEGTLRELLVAALGQAPGLSLFAPARLADALERMGRPKAVVDVPIGLEILSREGVEVLLTGSLGRMGTRYVLALELLHASGQSLGRLRHSFAHPRQLARGLDRLAGELRRRLGESARVVQQALPLERVSSPSLEAVRLYTQARQRLFGGELVEAISLLNRALDYDPDFPMALYSLAAAFWQLYDRDRALEYAERAAAVADRVGPLERRKILGAVYLLRGDFARAEQVFAALAHEQPDDPTPLINLGVAAECRGDFAGAVAATRRAVALLPRSRVRINLARQLLQLGDLPRAIELARAVLADLPGEAHAARVLGLALALAGEGEAAQALFAQMVRAGGPSELFGRLLLADWLAAGGCYRQAIEQVAAVRRIAQATGSRSAEQKALVRQVELWMALGEREQARQCLSGAPLNVRDPQLLYLRVRAAAAVDPASALPLLERFADGMPTPWRHSLSLLAQAEAALAAGEPLRAWAAAEQSQRLLDSVLAVDLLARAALAQGDRDAAALHLAALLRRAGQRVEAADGPALWPLALAEYRAGVLAHERGQTTAARQYLSRVLARCSAAEADADWVAEARARLAALGCATPAAST